MDFHRDRLAPQVTGIRNVLRISRKDRGFLVVREQCVKRTSFGGGGSLLIDDLIKIRGRELAVVSGAKIMRGEHELFHVTGALHQPGTFPRSLNRGEK